MGARGGAANATCASKRVRPVKGSTSSSWLLSEATTNALTGRRSADACCQAALTAARAVLLHRDSCTGLAASELHFSRCTYVSLI